MITQNTAVVTDSLACLPPELIKRYNIKIVPLSFIFKGKSYRDWVDVSPAQSYEMFLQDPDAFQASTPSPVEFLDTFRIVSKYASNIVCITLSSDLSTTFTAALLAKEQAVAELCGVNIEILDSRTTTAAEGLVALAAARAAIAGNNLSTVMAEAEKVVKKVAFIAMIDTIRHVYRSGRIPKVASRIGTVLNVKPLLSVTPESAGKVHFTGVVRSRQQGIERMLEFTREKAGKSPIQAAIMHSYAVERAVELQKEVSAQFNCQEIWLSEFSPLMGYATGTGTLGIAFYID